MGVINFREVNPMDQVRQPAPIPGSPLQPSERGLEFVRRATMTSSLDELYFFLTNDLRALLEFDRCSFIVHMGGSSRLTAVNNQPMMDKRTKFYEEISELARRVKLVESGIFFPTIQGHESFGGPAVSDDALDALRSYMAFSGCEHLGLVPLTNENQTLAHLLIEFSPGTRPNLEALSQVIKLGPLIGETLAHRWILAKKPSTKALISTRVGSDVEAVARLAKRLGLAAAALVLLVVLLFMVPFSATVGGEAEIVPRDLHVAFCKVDGIIDSVQVKEGGQVEKDSVLAALDPKELDYKIQSAETEFQVQTEQLLLLRSSADKEPAKLAESRLVELRRKNAWLELNYNKWQRQFLNILAPVSGIVTTKQIETLKGKKLKAGDSFCEIAVPGDLWAEVMVPEDRIANVAVGQPLRIYLNNEPLKAHVLTVKEVAPASEAHERLGNVYRVRGPFPAAEEFGKVGMKGIGKIDTQETNLWSIAGQRLLRLWNRLTLHFS